jgi:guanylate kinase
VGLKKNGLLFVVAAPSGAGKTSLCKALLKRFEAEGSENLSWSVSYTTRNKRDGEEHGRDYFFISDDEFVKMADAGGFAEHALVHGKRYGTSKRYLKEASDNGDDLLVEIDIQGARQLQENYQDAVFIFILPPSWPALEKRLRGRGSEKEDEIIKRLETAKKEVLEWSGFNYIIINEDFDDAVDRLRSVVLSCRNTKEAMEPFVVPVLESFKK